MSYSLSEKLNIVVEVPTFDADGVEQAVFSLVTGMPREQFRFMVVCVEHRGGAAERSHHYDAPVEILKEDKEAAYREFLRRYQADLVVSHSSPFGLPLAAQLGIPVIFFVPGVSARLQTSPWGELGEWDQYVSRYIAGSHEVADSLMHRFHVAEEKISVIPNGGDVMNGGANDGYLDHAQWEIRPEDSLLLHYASLFLREVWLTQREQGRTQTRAYSNDTVFRELIQALEQRLEAKNLIVQEKEALLREQAHRLREYEQRCAELIQLSGQQQTYITTLQQATTQRLEELQQLLVAIFDRLDLTKRFREMRTRCLQKIKMLLPSPLKRVIKGLLARFVPHGNGSGSTPASGETARMGAASPMLLVRPQIQHDDVDGRVESLTPPLSRRRADVICFSIIDWSFRYQRPQQIMSQFAAHGHRVFYINISQFRPVGAVPKFVVRPVKENVYEIFLTARPFLHIYGEVLGGRDLAALLESLDELRRTYDVTEAIGYVMIASWGNVALEVRRRWGWRVVYDCMDEWENFPGIDSSVLDMETQLVQSCDLLVVTAQRLSDKWRSHDRPLVLIRNGTDYDFYEQHCHPNSCLAEIPHPVVGYYGAIAEWFDVELMLYAARQRPYYTFVFLGGVFDIDVKTLAALPNVRLLGQQPYETMPRYLYHFDVCIIPFQVNQITEATDPVKVYEYLSGGKPVVATKLFELTSYQDYVYLAKDREEFVAYLDAALAENSPERTAQRKAFARQHTWENRFDRFAAGLLEVVPRASIIIVTYNNLAITKICVESLLRNTAYPHYEIIIVDNNSTDNTPAYLRDMERRHANLNVIYNAQNEGFARANNLGIARASGTYLVLLNNDTIVPPGWLTRLVRHLHDPSIGLVGPVTNAVGNEAKVEAPYRTWAEMEAFAQAYTWAHETHIADIGMLAMFCVALRREVYEVIGALDEQFGIGTFEDDDYSVRVKKAGYRVVCAADVFVHHFGQASFKKLIDRGEYDPLFEENRRRFETKWNVKWIPHRHVPLDFKPHF